MRKKFHSSEPQEMFLKNAFKSPTNDDDNNEDSEHNKMSGILHPHENDVLMGRGGKNNQHTGNEKLREIARERCEDYQNATKKGKSRISKELVRIVREMSPPGRFLKKDTETSSWEDVGDEIAREKTSQVLRDAVTYQMFGSTAKSHRMKINSDCSPSSKSKDFEPEDYNQDLMTPITSDDTLNNSAEDSFEFGEDTEHRGREQHYFSPLTNPGASMYPARIQHQQRELRSGNHFSPGASSFTNPHALYPPPAYMGVMRDPGMHEYSSAFSSASPSFHLPSVTPATSLPSSATRKRQRYQDSPASSSVYYGNNFGGAAAGGHIFSSPQPYYSMAPPGAVNTPPLTANTTTPSIVTNTPPITQNSPHHYFNATPARVNTLCSPHDSGQYRSPNNFPVNSYYPGASFATAHSPGAFSFYQSPSCNFTPSSAQQNVGSNDVWMPDQPISLSTRGTSEEVVIGSMGTALAPVAGGELDLMHEDLLSDTEREGAISPFQVSYPTWKRDGGLP